MLSVAAEAGNVAAFRLLLDAGADVGGAGVCTPPSPFAPHAPSSSPRHHTQCLACRGARGLARTAAARGPGRGAQPGATQGLRWLHKIRHARMHAAHAPRTFISRPLTCTH
jgi:hypothetical protein